MSSNALNCLASFWSLLITLYLHEQLDAGFGGATIFTTAKILKVDRWADISLPNGTLYIITCNPNLGSACDTRCNQTIVDYTRSNFNWIYNGTNPTDPNAFPGAYPPTPDSTISLVCYGFYSSYSPTKGLLSSYRVALPAPVSNVVC